MDIIDLSMLRKSAGLTQVQVAKALSLSQAQVSRYEADPAEVPMGIVKAWTELCGDVRKTLGINLPQNKRKVMVKALDDILNWFKFAPSTQGAADLPDLFQMVTAIKKVARKPRIAVAGKFDTGKSTLLNYLLGGKYLPTGYQPMTSLVCHIRHIDDKPSWQTEPVWIMKQGYNLDDPDDQANAEGNRLFAGGYDALIYAMNQERLASDARPVVAIKDAVAAVVYLSSPILEAADFFDLPGYSHNKPDHEKAGLASGIFDSLIYTSTASGFFDGQDLVHLRLLLDQLPPVTIRKNSYPLANLFVLCTQIHAITDSVGDKTREQVLSDILNGATQRAVRELDATIEAMSQRWEASVTPNTLRQRMFGFSVDDSAVRTVEVFTEDLKNYLSSIAPQSTFFHLKQILTVGKAKQIAALSALSTCLEQSVNSRVQAQSEFEEMSKTKEAFLRRSSEEMKRLNAMIDEYSNTTQETIKKVYSKYINLEFVEKWVRASYQERKEAEEYLASFLIDKVQREISKEVSLLSKQLNTELSNTLGSMTSFLSPASSIPPFDLQSAFLSALAGASAVGALAGWVAIVANGSNLGAYILAAKVVGWLSRLGVSVGSPAVVMSTIAALGGPVTVSIVIGIFLAGGLYASLGRDWQSRIAKKTVEQLHKQKLEDQLLEVFNGYWTNTKSALKESMDKTLKSYDDYLAERSNILSLSESDLNARVTMTKNVEGFLRSMPLLPEAI